MAILSVVICAALIITCLDLVRNDDEDKDEFKVWFSLDITLSDKSLHLDLFDHNRLFLITKARSVSILSFDAKTSATTTQMGLRFDGSVRFPSCPVHRYLVLLLLP